MNKKLNTLLFMVAATILNLLILIVLACILVAVFALLYKGIDDVSPGLAWLAIIVILFGSIGGTFFLYSRIIRWIADKWKLEDYIAPIFKTSRKH